MQNQDYARTQAAALDNIAPTPQQAAAASQYAVTDGFLSSEEQTAVLRQIATDRPALQKKLDEVGITKEYLAANPDVERTLFAGHPTPVLTIQLPNGLQLQGRLRVAITEDGPQLRIIPVRQELAIPEKIGDIKLSDWDRQELLQNGYVRRPIELPENGGFASGFLKVDKATNTVDVWRINPQSLPTKLMGVDLTRDQQIALATGHPIKLSGLKDRQGEPFDATISLSVERKGILLSNIGQQDVALKTDDKFRSQLAHDNDGAKTDQTRGLEEKAGHTVENTAKKETLQGLLNADKKIAQHSKKLTP